MKTIVLPILPGRTEAWRRFLQELRGSRREMFEEWCAQFQVQNLRISVWENQGMALMIVCFDEYRIGVGRQHIDVDETPFMRWLREQLLALHGLDLAALSAGHSPAVLLET